MWAKIVGLPWWPAKVQPRHPTRNPVVPSGCAFLFRDCLIGRMLSGSIAASSPRVRLEVSPRRQARCTARSAAISGLANPSEPLLAVFPWQNFSLFLRNQGLRMATTGSPEAFPGQQREICGRAAHEDAQKVLRAGTQRGDAGFAEAARRDVTSGSKGRRLPGAARPRDRRAPPAI